MKLNIAKNLAEIYKKQHKNYDYAIISVLDNLDPDSYRMCFEIVQSLIFEGEEYEITLGKEVVERIKADFEKDDIDTKTVELLLWMGAALPEV